MYLLVQTQCLNHFKSLHLYSIFSRYVVSLSIGLTQFGTTIVYVLLAAENIVKLLPESSSFNCCYVALIVGATVTPFTWLGTPKEFWYKLESTQ